jgi:hypothetical protein
VTPGRRLRSFVPPALAPAAALFLFSALPAPAIVAEAPLSVHAPALSWSSSSVHLTVTQSGTLAGKKLSVYVFVDNNMIEGFKTGGEVTKHELSGLELEPGSHALLVKTGTYEATDRFRYVPALYPAAAAGLIAVAALAAAALRTRRRGSA